MALAGAVEKRRTYPTFQLYWKTRFKPACQHLPVIKAEDDTLADITRAPIPFYPQDLLG